MYKLLLNSILIIFFSSTGSLAYSASISISAENFDVGYNVTSNIAPELSRYTHFSGDDYLTFLDVTIEEESCQYNWAAECSYKTIGGKTAHVLNSYYYDHLMGENIPLNEIRAGTGLQIESDTRLLSFGFESISITSETIGIIFFDKFDNVLFAEKYFDINKSPCIENTKEADCSFMDYSINLSQMGVHRIMFGGESGGVEFSSIRYNAVPVPAPGTVWLFITALMGLGFKRYKAEIVKRR